MSSLLLNPAKLRIVLLLIGAVCAIAAYLLYRIRQRKSGEAKGPVILLNLERESAPGQENPAVPTEAAAPVPSAPVTVPSPGYTVQTLQSRPSLATDLMRMGLVVLAFVVAAGFILILVPQGTVDSMSQGLEARSGVAPKQETIALLYLGDEIKDNEFHVRGVVRNITTQPVEKLDALLRLYGSNGDLLETAIVRMDKESIAPDETAQFHLVFPDYHMQFARYMVDFKLRQGSVIAYKDMRAAQPQNQ